MLREYNYPVDETLVRQLAGDGQWAAAFEELARPLHEALYEAQTFDLLDQLTTLEQIVLSLDYVQMQVTQGGFIQLIQNGYVLLLVSVIEAAQALDLAGGLQQTLDDALKVYVLNHQALSRETTPQEFAGLYEEFREFESLDKAFQEILPIATEVIILRAVA